MVELVDTPDLGSGAAMRGGSSPFTRTNLENGLNLLLESCLPEFRQISCSLVNLNPAKIYEPHQKYKIDLASSDLKLLQT